jgi:hypothetical protein
VGEIGTPPAFFAPDTPRDLLTPSPTNRVFVTDDYSKITYYWDVDQDRWVAFGETSKDVSFFIDPVAGDDANQGDALNPLLTIMEAIRRIPPLVKHLITLDMVGGSAGAPNLFDEQVTLEYFTYGAGGKIIFSGKEVTNSSNVATGGDFVSIIVGGAGWTPGALVGQCVVFTAGPHTGLGGRGFILANTADTLRLGRPAFGSEGPYGVGDVFDIRELTCQIKQDSQFFVFPTLEINNQQGMERFLLTEGELYFEKVIITGDKDLGAGVIFSGGVKAVFEDCRLEDYVTAVAPGEGNVFLFKCMGNLEASGLTSTPWFSSSPGWAGQINTLHTGIVGSLNYDYNSDLRSQLSNSVFRPSPSLGQIFKCRRGVITSVGSYYDGLGTAVPFALEDVCEMQIALSDGRIDNSVRSGITPFLAGSVLDGFGQADIRLGNMIMDGNAEYAIDLTGPHVITFDDDVNGDLNGIGGLRLRNGAKAVFKGTVGNEPTISDASGANRMSMGYTPDVWFPFTSPEMSGPDQTHWANYGT